MGKYSRLVNYKFSPLGFFWKNNPPNREFVGKKITPVGENFKKYWQFKIK